MMRTVPVFQFCAYCLIQATLVALLALLKGRGRRKSLAWGFAAVCYMAVWFFLVVAIYDHFDDPCWGWDPPAIAVYTVWGAWFLPLLFAVLAPRAKHRAPGQDGREGSGSSRPLTNKARRGGP